MNKRVMKGLEKNEKNSRANWFTKSGSKFIFIGACYKINSLISFKFLLKRA